MDRLGGPFPCVHCQRMTHAAAVRTNIWQGERLIVVEDIPAQVCEPCGEQYYHPLIGEALRSFVAHDLEEATPKRVIEVPVYSLEGRISAPPAEEQEEPEA